MEKITLKVDGMHCTSCEMLIKDALEDLEGVSDVEAAHAAGTVLVEFDGSKADPEEFKKLIRAEGFKVE